MEMAKDMSDSLEPEKFRWSFTTISNNGDSPPGTHAAGSAHDDAFDLDSLRLPQDFSASTGVKKILTTVPIRRPDPQEFIRVHPDPAWRLQTLVLEVKAYRETYLIHPSLHDELLARHEVVPKVLFTTVTRQDVLLLWPIRLPDRDGRLDS
jgi:hypothetical protein